LTLARPTIELITRRSAALSTAKFDVALPANIGRHVAAALDTVIKQVAATPFDEQANEEVDASADAPQPHSVGVLITSSGQNASADAPDDDYVGVFGRGVALP